MYVTNYEYFSVLLSVMLMGFALGVSVLRFVER